jgi:hypothetical protein
VFDVFGGTGFQMLHCKQKRTAVTGLFVMRFAIKVSL